MLQSFSLTFLSIENGEIYSAIIAVLTVNAIILVYVWFAFDEEKFAKIAATTSTKDKIDEDQDEKEEEDVVVEAKGNSNLKKRRN